MRLPVTVLAGLDDATRQQVAEALLATAGHPVAVVEHDLSELAGGWVTRTVRSRAGLLHRDRIAVDHACAACTLQASVVPLLISLAQREEFTAVVLSLPAPIEPETVAAALDSSVIEGIDARDLIRVDAALTVVDPASLPDEMATDDLLVDRGTALATSDRRAVAEVLARQIEYANVLVAKPAGGPGVALLSHLNPHARLVGVGEVDARSLLHTGLHGPATSASWVERGSISAPLMESYGGVTTVVWEARRPFHPQRLYDALPDIVSGVARSRGSVWLASRPAERFCWESAGQSMSMGTLGPWLAELPAERWHEVGPAHRARAALDWDPTLGDRGTSLVFTGVALDPARLRELLATCLTGPDEWDGRPVSPLDDPFAAFLESAP
jgi:G3E family GTPase